MEINELESKIFEKKNKLKELHQDLQTRQNELKSLNELLNSRLDRLTFRKASSEIRHSSSKDSKENMILIYKVAAKRKKILINDIKVLKDIEASSKIEKAWSLENLIKEKDKRIEIMKIELKNLMNLIRTLEKTINELEKVEEHAKTVMTLVEKSGVLNNKLLFLKESFEEKIKFNEKKIEFIQFLEKKYTALNKNPSVSEIKTEVYRQKIENHEDSGEKSNRILYKSLKDYMQSNGEVTEYSEKAFLRLRKAILNLNKSLVIDEKSYKREFKLKERIIEEHIKENDELSNRLKEREKELVLLNERSNQFKEIKKSRISLKPLISASFFINKNEEFTKKHLRKITFSSKNTIFKRILQSGNSFSEDVVDFDDSFYIETSKLHSVASIYLFHHNSWLFGFQIKYKELGSEEFLFFGAQNLINYQKPYQTTEFSLKENDFIINIQGLYSNRIEALKFVTKKGVVFSFNYTEKCLKLGKTFEILCKKNWICSSLIGGFDYFKERELWGLVYIGMEIIKKPELNSSLIVQEEDAARKSEFKQIMQENNGKNRGKSAALEYKFKKKIQI